MADFDSVVTDEIAMAFHRAISDASFSKDDIEETKLALRAVLNNGLGDAIRAHVVPEGYMVVKREPDNAMALRALSAPIPGGSNARDWFLPHETERGRNNVIDVVLRMFRAMTQAGELK